MADIDCKTAKSEHAKAKANLDQYERLRAPNGMSTVNLNTNPQLRQAWGQAIKDEKQARENVAGACAAPAPAAGQSPATSQGSQGTEQSSQQVQQRREPSPAAMRAATEFVDKNSPIKDEFGPNKAAYTKELERVHAEVVKNENAINSEKKGKTGAGDINTIEIEASRRAADDMKDLGSKTVTAKDKQVEVVQNREEAIKVLARAYEVSAESNKDKNEQAPKTQSPIQFGTRPGGMRVPGAGGLRIRIP